MEKQYYDLEKLNCVKDFISLGFTDYIAARVLINNGLLIQGICLASTSIEKYFKAIVALTGNIPHKHLDRELIQQIQVYDLDLFNQFNSTFLELLSKAYKLRYSNDLPAGFSVVLIQYPILAEIDFMVQKMESQFSFFEDGEKLVLGFQRLNKERDNRLLEKNFLFLDINKDEFISGLESKVHCIRIMSIQGQHRKIEITYTAEKQLYDGNFLRVLKVIHKPSIKDSRIGFDLPYPKKVF